MNEIKKEDYTKILNRLFWGLLLMFLNISFSITIQNVSYSIEIAYFVGVIIILVTLWKYMNSNKTIKILCYVLLGCIAFGVLSLFTPLFVSNDTLASVENIKQIISQENVTQGDLNSLIDEILNIKSAALLSIALSLVIDALPMGATFYFSGLLVKEIANSYKLPTTTKAKRDSLLCVVFLVLCEVLSFVMFLSLFSVIEQVRFNYEGVVFLDGFYGAITSLSLSSLVTIPVAITYLVFIIKLLVDINKVKMSVSLAKEDDNVIDVVDSSNCEESNKNDNEK